MWIKFLRRSSARRRPSRARTAVSGAVLAICLLGSSPVMAQQLVFDPRNHLENALQAARQLESLANEARSLAASPYSHLTQSNQSLSDMADLARTARGLASSVNTLEQQLQDLYPDASSDADLEALLGQRQARTSIARRTAEDLARTAAELERMGQGRAQRLAGALSASQSASGQTAAMQSSNQLLAVLAEDLASLRTILLAQSRLLAQATAREAADSSAGDAARRQRWARDPATPPAPRFDPFVRSGD